MEKWYFDILTPELDYLYLYFAIVRFHRYTEANVAYSVYLKEFDKIISSGFTITTNEFSLTNNPFITKFPGGSISNGQSMCEIQLQTPDMNLFFSYPWNWIPNNTQKVFKIKTHRSDGILWQPNGMSKDVSGRFSIQNIEREVCASQGYADHLKLSIFPLKSPVRKLHWGRIIHKEVQLTYTCTIDVNGISQNQLVLHICNTTTRLNMFLVEDVSKEQQKCFKIYTENDDIKISIIYTFQYIVAEANFFKTVNGSIKRKLFRYISRDPQGNKYLAIANIKINTKDKQYEYKDIPFIAELITFR